jgi:hypothetical protein
VRNPLADDHDEDWEAGLRQELGGMKLGALKKRARGLGVGAEAIEELDDADEPKAEAIRLVIAATPRPAPARPQPQQTRVSNPLAEAEVEGQSDAEWEAALRQELGGMKLGALKKRARGLGVGAEAIEELDDADEPKMEAIRLVIAATPRPAPARRRAQPGATASARAGAGAASPGGGGGEGGRTPGQARMAALRAEKARRAEAVYRQGYLGKRSGGQVGEPPPPPRNGRPALLGLSD